MIEEILDKRSGFTAFALSRMTLRKRTSLFLSPLGERLGEGVPQE